MPGSHGPESRTGHLEHLSLFDLWEEKKKHLEAFGARQRGVLGWKGFVRLSEAETVGSVCWLCPAGTSAWEEHPAQRAPGCAKLSHRRPQGPFMLTQCVPSSGPVTSAELGIKSTTKPCAKQGNPLF